MSGLRIVSIIVAAAVACGGALAAQPRGHRPAEAPAGVPQVPEMRIAAVVNDEMISVYDLAERIRMVMVSSNLGDSPELRQKIAGQVLRNLIDEKLELQEARRQSISASDEEVNNALGQIEKQNNMRPGQLDEYLKSRGIDRAQLVTQVSATIVWAKLVRRLAGQTSEVSDDEIDEMLRRLKEHANEPQSRVAEIFLAVDNPGQDEEVHRLAERLSTQMRQGARFSAVAQQFSQSATAAVGGDIGWVRPDQLPPELGKTVAQLKPGELSPPIRAGGGYYLMLVVDRRTGTTGGGQNELVYDVVQVVVPLPPRAGEPQKRIAVGEIEAIRTAAKDCPSLLQLGKQKAPQLSSEGQIRASQIAPEMRKLLDGLQVGQTSQPILQRNGVGVVMLCKKSNGDAPGQITRDVAAEALGRQRLETLARRYLRDLRRASYVDIRIGSNQ